MPFEFLQTNFSNQTYAKLKKKNTYLLLLCRSSILRLLYLCNLGSQRSKISSFCSPLSLLSNPAGLIKIGFSKKYLFQISYDDLIINGFSRVNLYEVPRVTVSTFSLGNDTKNYYSSYFYTFL